MACLTREQILKADDLKTETVPVPEWGGDVIVRTMTGFEYSKFEQSINSPDEGKTDLTNLRAKLCSMTIVNEEGEKIFLEDDIIELSKKSAGAINRVFNVAQRLNLIGADDGSN